MHRLQHRNLVGDLAATLRDVRPAALIPCDDHAAALLMQLHGECDLASMIESALGDPASYPVAGSKSRQMALSAELGLPMPATQPIADFDALVSALNDGDFPRVLKADGTAGGTGVAVIRDLAGAKSAWDRLFRPPSLIQVLARVGREGNIRSIVARRQWQERSCDLQSFVAGIPANRAVLCNRGYVLAGVSVEVLQTLYPNGPGSVVRVIDHPDMTASAAAMVKRLGLSGFLGFDFVLDESSGHALMIEMNPRATPICSLPIGDAAGTDFAGALFSLVTGLPASPVPPVPSDTIAVFPGEWYRDPSSHFLRDFWHDVPWDDPELLYAYLDEIRAEHRFARLKSALGRGKKA